MALPESEYRWNLRAARYRDSRGRFVPRAVVRREIDRALKQAKRRMASLAEQLRAGNISLDDWYAQMRRELKNVHLYSAAAAKGGWAQLSQADLGRVGALVREQYGFLENFANQIAGSGDATGDAGALPLDGRFLRRVALYGESGRRTYHRTERVEMETRGYDLEENILAASDHCAGCLGETARGPVPIGELVPVGERDCHTNCKCRIRYISSATGQVAA